MNDTNDDQMRKYRQFENMPWTSNVDEYNQYMNRDNKYEFSKLINNNKLAI